LIRNTVCKAGSRAIAIHRCFISRDITLLVRAYTSYVRPMAESNSVMWSPSAIGRDTETTTERVQRNSTKKLAGLQSLPYTERLKRLICFAFILLSYQVCSMSEASRPFVVQ